MVEGTGFENQRAGNCTESSNLSASALQTYYIEMEKYTPTQVSDYSSNREKFNETDKELFAAMENVGIKDKAIVDFGCGDGRHARQLKALGAASVTGVDINSGFIDIANNANTDETITYLVTDGKSIPVENESADTIMSNFVIHYFADAESIFSEIRRVLKDGGHFVGTFNITDVDEGFEHLYNTQMPINLGQGSVIIQNLIKSREEIEQAIADCGFAVLKEEELDHPYAVVDDSFPDKEHIHKHAVLMVLQKK